MMLTYLNLYCIFKSICIRRLGLLKKAVCSFVEKNTSHLISYLFNVNYYNNISIHEIFNKFITGINKYEYIIHKKNKYISLLIIVCYHKLIIS